MKKFCILEQGRYVNDPLSVQKRELFTRDFCDFYRLNWSTPEDPASDFYQSKLLFSEGRTFLYDVVQKNYEYYIFIDDDTEFITEDPASEILRCLEKWKPLCATFQEVSSGKIVYENPEGKEAFCITDYDQQTNVYHRSFMENVFPFVCHASGGVSLFCQYLGNKIAPNKQVCFDSIRVRNTRHEHDTFAHPERVARSESVVDLVWKVFNQMTHHKDFPHKFRDAQNCALTYGLSPSAESFTLTKDHVAGAIDDQSEVWKSRSPVRSKQLAKLLISRDKLKEHELQYLNLLLWWEENVR